MPKILILGATGMLGHVLFRELSLIDDFEVHATARDVGILRTTFTRPELARVLTGVDGLKMETVNHAIHTVKPDVVVNAVGVIKQDPKVKDAEKTVALNALFPHALAAACSKSGARLIHVSTDCVFSGNTGGYSEQSQPSPSDFYGLSKQLGETFAPTLVLRTSIIGHELSGHRSLVDWFLGQNQTVRGFTRAIYSGLTTTEFARFIASVAVPRTDLMGLLHVASEPISKHDLLSLVAAEYSWPGSIVPDDSMSCDRSMRADLLFELTGYRPPDWATMIKDMRKASLPWRHLSTGTMVA